MTRKPKTVRTIHHADVIASLEAQSQAVLNLLHAVSTALSIDGEKFSPTVRETLEAASDATHAAMWPQED